MEPVSHNERCVSVNVKTQLDGRQLRTSWSPLTGDQLEAVCQEAHKLANQLQSGERSQSHSEDDKDNEATAAVTTQPDEFVQDSQAKLHVFEQSNRVLSPIKRETFCVQESPLKQLPPAIQQRLLRGSSNTSIVSSLRSANAPLSTRPASAHPKSVVKPACVTRLSTSSPVTRARSQPKAGLRGKAPLGAVLPSKPAAPVASTSTTKSRVEKNRLQPPSRVSTGWVTVRKRLLPTNLNGFCVDLCFSSCRQSLAAGVAPRGGQSPARSCCLILPALRLTSATPPSTPVCSENAIWRHAPR